MAVCSEIHTKHINTLCGQNVELLNVKLAVHIVTTEIDLTQLLENVSASQLIIITVTQHKPAPPPPAITQ